MRVKDLHQYPSTASCLLNHMSQTLCSKKKKQLRPLLHWTEAHRKKVLAELIQVSMELEETIKSSTIRNTCVDHLIKQLTMKLPEGDAQVEAKQEEEEA